MNDVLQQLVDALGQGKLRIVDLTQPLGENTPVIELPEAFAATPGFSRKRLSCYDEAGPAWYWNAFSLGEHTGTHFDAPVHWVTGKDLPENACDTIPPARFIRPACVLDVSTQAAKDPDFLLTCQHVERWEAQHGRIPAGAWALMRTDWGQRVGAAFLNAREDGPHSPGFALSAVKCLIERDVLGVGVETVGTDAGQAAGLEPPFPCHHLMHGAGKFGLASLCNLDRLPPTGAVVVAAPLKLVKGSGSPLRVLALAPSP